MSRFIDADELLNKLPDDLPYKASVKRVLMQAPTAENESLKAREKELVNENAELKNQLKEKIAEEDTDLSDELLKLHIEGIKEAKAYTVREIQTYFAVRFGTYTPDDVVNITEVFSLLAKIEKEMLQ